LSEPTLNWSRSLSFCSSLLASASHDPPPPPPLHPNRLQQLHRQLQESEQAPLAPPPVPRPRFTRLQLLQEARSTCAKEVASTKLHLQVRPPAAALDQFTAHVTSVISQSLRNSLSAARKVSIPLNPPPTPHPPLPHASLIRLPIPRACFIRIQPKTCAGVHEPAQSSGCKRGVRGAAEEGGGSGGGAGRTALNFQPCCSHVTICDCLQLCAAEVDAALPPVGESELERCTRPPLLFGHDS
jgi:hypothetical protein